MCIFSNTKAQKKDEEEDEYKQIDTIKKCFFSVFYEF